MKIDINGVSITLTKEQLAEIAKQTSKKQYTLNNLHSYQNACTILDELPKIKPSYEDQLKTIIRAANYIDNGNKEWIPNFEDSSNKYIPYLKKTSSGWVLDFVYCYFWLSSRSPVGFYYLKESTAKLIFKRFSSLYNNWIG